ncbi:hypothetical protein Ddye_020920 [Dipteronia dyeriana]|uniref:RNase H type-1 domain-containing protein n=1 Tax=Dipteronia dyeriana TaxID=168575 RepID=A0AAD9U0M5_9ROSI|nr:hypothetical protein Ddye_020920 [Dipteronia dyeriana]
MMPTPRFWLSQVPLKIRLLIGANRWWRCFKVNTDAAVNRISKWIDVGIMVAEGVALLRRIRFAVDSGLVHAFIDFDAKAVVDLVLIDVAPQANVGVIISDILSLTYCNVIYISYMSRSANMVAHSLATLVCLLLRIVFGSSLVLLLWSP